MSKLTERYRAFGIHNEHGFAGNNVFLSYTPNGYGRGGHGSRWQVIKGDEQTEPTEPWYNYGKKTFTVSSHSHGTTHAEGKQKALEAAQVWASEKYKIKQWARTPYGSWMDAGFVKKRIAYLGKRI